jgi:mono/diheme cytochrome c family protein
MSKILLILSAAMITPGALIASDSKPSARIPATDGKAMYASYCATCHGIDGKGNGLRSSSLKRTPSDLTLLSRKNGGAYPSARVVAVIGHGTSVSGHDKTGMPVWAPTLDTMDQNNKLETPLRISNLSKYLETLQVK